MVKTLPAKQENASPIPGLGRSPREGNGNPLQCSCLENPLDRGAWRLQSRGHKGSVLLTATGVSPVVPHMSHV